MQNIWFTSDTHYNHSNIVKGTTCWENSEDKVRDFNTLEEHNSTLINSINSLVKYNDVLYHLGDWSFGGYENIKKFRDQLNCREIHLILGNHDQHIEPIDSPYRELFTTITHKKELNLKISSNKSGKYGKQLFFLSHYSHQVWNKSHHNSIHLFGHSHGSLIGIGRSMDIGVDTNNLYPYHLDEILYRMKDIKSETVDYHNKNTN